MKENLVLIGNGMAGVRTLEEVLKLEPEKYNITVFGEEPYGNYNRIMLSPVLASEKTIDEIMLNDEQWYSDNNITLHKGIKVTEPSSADAPARRRPFLMISTSSKANCSSNSSLSNKPSPNTCGYQPASVKKPHTA